MIIAEVGILVQKLTFTEDAVMISGEKEKNRTEKEDLKYSKLTIKSKVKNQKLDFIGSKL
ncbi:MAG: hypothetical protein F6K24_55935 [Okeania sp. SIO2D1]|nr:hypothetical protein [Okeania sp. SIO2D1]